MSNCYRLLYYFTRLATSTKGTMALEAHIERPNESAAFQKFPRHPGQCKRATAIICDYLRMVGMSADDPHQIEDLLARELKKTQGRAAARKPCDAEHGGRVTGARDCRRRARRH